MGHNQDGETTHHSVVTSSYDLICKKCGKWLGITSPLTDEERNAHKKVIKRMYCPDCKKKVAYRMVLKGEDKKKVEGRGQEPKMEIEGIG